MLLKELIIQENEYTEILDTLFTECKQFLEESKLLPLYRGMINTNTLFTKKEIRKDRNTAFESMKDKLFFAGVDNGMKRYFDTYRTNSIQATGSFNTAKIFGHVYVIFPVDGYKYLWSTVVKDYAIYSFHGQLKNEKDDNYDRGLEFVNQFKNSYKNTDLYKAIESDNEILISGSYYYCVRYYEQDEKYFNDLMWERLYGK